MVLAVAPQVLPARRHVQVQRFPVLVGRRGGAGDELLHQGALPFPDARIVDVHAPAPVAGPGRAPGRLRIGSEIRGSKGSVAVGRFRDVDGVDRIVRRDVPDHLDDQIAELAIGQLGQADLFRVRRTVRLDGAGPRVRLDPLGGVEIDEGRDLEPFVVQLLRGGEEEVLRLTLLVIGPAVFVPRPAEVGPFRPTGADPDLAAHLDQRPVEHLAGRIAPVRPGVEVRRERQLEGGSRGLVAGDLHRRRKRSVGTMPHHPGPRRHARRDRHGQQRRSEGPLARHLRRGCQAADLLPFLLGLPHLFPPGVEGNCVVEVRDRDDESAPGKVQQIAEVAVEQDRVDRHHEEEREAQPARGRQRLRDAAVRTQHHPHHV